MLTEHLGIRAEAEDLFDLTPERLGMFDAVTFNKVLEHVEDPVSLLAHAGAFLRKGGFCYVEVPDVAAASAGADREEFFIEHHHVFSPASLALLGERAGFEVVQVERLIEPSGKFTVYAFMTQKPVEI
jgi:SAM-dependent methyltransferase